MSSSIMIPIGPCSFQRECSLGSKIVYAIHSPKGSHDLTTSDDLVTANQYETWVQGSCE